MGKKKSRANKPIATSAASDGADEGGSFSFAEKLLQSMNIDSSKGDKEPSEAVQSIQSEEAIEEVDEDEDVKHPHLHQIHRSIKSVFGRSRSISRSQSRSSSRASSSRQSRSSSQVRSEGAAEPANSDETIPTPTTPSNPPPTTQAAQQSTAEGSSVATEGTATEGASKGGKKRNRRKEKLAERERERARIVQEAEQEAKTVPDKRAIELKGMGMMIAKAGLVEHESQPDGHCLFHSLCDQLLVRCNIETNVDQLRSTLANYIREYPDDFVPYLVEDETGDVCDINKYTSDLENTPMWGGELEIMAASRKYERPIRVHFASQVPLDVNVEVYPDVPPLHLAYYQAKFGLGAHYNSLRDAPQAAAHEGAAPNTNSEAPQTTEVSN